MVCSGSRNASGRYFGRSDGTALYRIRIFRGIDIDGPRDDVIYGHSTPHGCALADSAQCRLRKRDPRSVAFLVAGEEGRDGTENLRCDSSGAPGRQAHSLLVS